MTYIIHADMELWDFMLDGVKNRKDVKTFPLNRYCNIIQRYIRNRYRDSLLPNSMILGRRMRKELKKLVSGDNIIISAYTQRCLFNAISKTVVSGVNIHLWMWNPISSKRSFKNDIELLRNDGFKLHTFDHSDSEKYNMKHHNTFYNMNVNKNQDVILKNDFYFLGAIKNRKNEIDNARCLLNGYKCLFCIPKNSEEFISYKENLINVEESRCLVEIVQGNQYDITLRPLEALAFKKKLITNNKHIKDYEFYDRENIFIIGEDDEHRLNSFLNSPYKEVDQYVVEKYDINFWVNSF